MYCIRTEKASCRREFNKMCKEIIEGFDNLPMLDIQKPRVGIVGEILVKFLPAANKLSCRAVGTRRCEAVVPDLLDFFLYCFYNSNFKAEKLGMKKATAYKANLGIKALEWFRAPAAKAFAQSKHFDPPAKITDLADMAKDIVSLGNQTGEGWFLTGEMLELIHNARQTLSAPSHLPAFQTMLSGKGVIKELRRRYPLANVVAIDYDPGASEVNQLNRIKLMLSTANKNLSKNN